MAEKKIHRLIIKDAKGEDEGQYTVVFKEKDLKSSAKLAVKGIFNSCSNYNCCLALLWSSNVAFKFCILWNLRTAESVMLRLV